MVALDPLSYAPSFDPKIITCIEQVNFATLSVTPYGVNEWLARLSYPEHKRNDYGI
jgi:hypothetical protein